MQALALVEAMNGEEQVVYILRAHILTMFMGNVVLLVLPEW
jgi:hypothetical protein